VTASCIRPVYLSARAETFTMLQLNNQSNIPFTLSWLYEAPEVKFNKDRSHQQKVQDLEKGCLLGEHKREHKFTSYPNI